MVFNACMKFRKRVIKDREDVKLFSTLTEAVESTLCPLEGDAQIHKLCCLARECQDCGRSLFHLLPEQQQMEPEVSWKHIAGCIEAYCSHK